MKKIFALAASAALVLAVAACSKADNAATEENASENIENAVLDANADVAADVTNPAAEATTEAAEEATAEPGDVIDQAAEAATDAINKAKEKAEVVKAVVDQVKNPTKYTAETIRPDSKVGRVTVLDFNATWCIPCKKLTPVFKAAEKTFEGKVDFIEIDIDKYAETAKAFGVQNVPTVVVIRPDGKSNTYVGTNDLLPGEKFTKIITDALK